MANESVTIPKLTRAVAFKEIRAQDDKPLLQICEGIELDHALTEASCLEGAVRQVLDDVAGGGEMNGDVAHLCEFALATAQALRSASYGR